MLQPGWNLKVLCLVEETRHKGIYHTIPLIWNVYIRQIHGDNVNQGLLEGGRSENFPSLSSILDFYIPPFEFPVYS